MYVRDAILHTKCLWRGKCFHLMTSSWNWESHMARSIRPNCFPVSACTLYLFHQYLVVDIQGSCAIKAKHVLPPCEFFHIALDNIYEFDPRNIWSQVQSVTTGTHDDVIKWRHLPRYWPFVRGIHRSPVNSPRKASDADLWCFLWSVPEPTVK